MKVSSLLTEVLLKKFCESLEEELNESEAPSSELTTLLSEAKIKVFDKYKIDPKTQTYFLAGSARLHLYPKLQEVMNVGPIGDLDIVIPKLPEITKKLAQTPTDTNTKPDNPSGADTKTNDLSKPIEPVEPGTKIAVTDKIEIFDKWDPTKAKPEGAKDFSIRSTDEILKSAKSVKGYWYMSLYDVMDYKLNLNRDKEKNLTIELSNYLNASDEKTKEEIKIKILQAFAGNKKAATDFLKPAVLKQKQAKSQAPPSSPSAEPKQTPPTQQKQAEK
jgi:hypothetical protein